MCNIFLAALKLRDELGALIGGGCGKFTNACAALYCSWDFQQPGTTAAQCRTGINLN